MLLFFQKGFRMEGVEKERVYRVVKMATGQDSVEQKFVEECSELACELAKMQICVLKGKRLDDLIVEDALGEVVDFINTLEQVTGERDICDRIHRIHAEKLAELRDRAIDGNLKSNMAWQKCT